MNTYTDQQSHKNDVLATTALDLFSHGRFCTFTVSPNRLPYFHLDRLSLSLCLSFSLSVSLSHTNTHKDRWELRKPYSQPMLIMCVEHYVRVLNVCVCVRVCVCVCACSGVAGFFFFFYTLLIKTLIADQMSCQAMKFESYRISVHEHLLSIFFFQEVSMTSECLCFVMFISCFH